MLTVLFDGIAYGMLLFILSCGLAVTLGLMNFVNLAHGAFAMAGGYVTAVSMNRAGMPFLLCLPLAFLAAAALGVVLERTLYVRLYGKSHLDQVLFSIGLVFMAMSTVDYLFGAQQQLVELPAFLTGQIQLLGARLGIYRLFLITVCAVIALLLQLVLVRTRFGSQLRASVDDARVARGLGMNVDRIFALTFAAGSGLAGLGGALGIQLLSVDPTFPVKYMIYFLIVVTVGGTTSMTGPFLAALLIGVADIAGKYYLPELGAFMIYSVMVVVLILKPKGLFGQAGAR
ncbi:branched-chain amino acid ABC transporter permease [Benzoatithermus flavus]|uniref:Branched-chain amino acid ABC transporter permease n=1 Tax=Benzoatithermus flavus TaxID=3108223 RepID=A0ABU8XV02_9PROT